MATGFLAMQAPGAVTSLQATVAAPAGLRRPANRTALKSPFQSGGGALADAVAATGGLAATSRLSMRAAAKNAAYICTDCGYIYNERKAFDSLSADYSCPVCSAPKRRFKPYDSPVSRNANDLSVRKARKEDLKKADAAVGQVLPIAIAVGVVALVGTFIYLNSTL